MTNKAVVLDSKGYYYRLAIDCVFTIIIFFHSSMDQEKLQGLARVLSTLPLFFPDR